MALRFLQSKGLVCLLATVTGCLSSAYGQGSEAPMLPHAHRVVFLGDSITYAGEFVELVDAYFVTRFPNRTVEFLDLGLPSETVSGLSEPGHAGGQFPRPDLHERLARVLDQTKPDLVIACYGMNDGIYLPYSDERFEKFRDGLEWLRARVLESGAKIIHVTPPTFDEVKGGHAGYAATLDRYAEWMLAQRSRGWDVIDLHSPMTRALMEHRREDPQFFFAGDGVHPNAAGHWLIAKQLLVQLGAKDLDNINDAQAMVASHPHGTQILALVQRRQRVLKDAWLTATGHKRPGMNRGLPLAEAQAQAAQIAEQIRALQK